MKKAKKRVPNGTRFFVLKKMEREKKINHVYNVILTGMPVMSTHSDDHSQIVYRQLKNGK